MGNSLEQRCEVLVIGAGPTGLMAAYLLHRAGIQVRIVDKNAAAVKESRAAVMSPRSLELFASLDLDGKLSERGVITTEIDFFVSGAVIGGVRYDKAHAPDTPFRFILMIPQSATEEVLIAALTEAGLSVERGVEVVGFEQTDNNVQIAARRDNEEFSVSADYVIGADGAHSVVREGLNLGFSGSKYPQDFLLGDVEVDWELDRQRFRIFVHGDRVALFLPLYGQRSRIMTTDVKAVTSGEGVPETDTLDLTTLERTFAEVARVPLKLRDPDWLTQFRTHHRMVDRYRVGRMFVAGDAAHIHSPAGGQGMNTGLQDAANIAWKLAAVLRHGAAPELLNTYETERLPVAREVVRFTDQVFNIAAGKTGWQAKLRDALAPILVGGGTKFDFVQDRVFRKFGQIDISYPPSLAVSKAGEAPVPAPGQRAPNAQISRHQDVFDLIAGYRFTVLALSRKRLTDKEIGEVSQGLATIKAPTCATHIVARTSVGRNNAVEVVERVDVFEAYGLDDDQAQALIVVRPDGYIAWRAETLNFIGCREFLRSVD